MGRDCLLINKAINQKDLLIDSFFSIEYELV